MRERMFAFVFTAMIALADASFDRSTVERLSPISSPLFEPSGVQLTEQNGLRDRAIDSRKAMHTLFYVVAEAEREGGVAIGAKFERCGGSLFARVEIAKVTEGDLSERFAEFLVDATIAAWRPIVRPCVSSLRASELRSQCALFVRSKLCLAEVIALTECLTESDVEAITPTSRDGHLLFAAEVVNSSGERVSAVIDPETCSLVSISKR